MMLSVFINTVNGVSQGDRLNYLLLTLLQINSQRAYSNPNMYIGVMFRGTPRGDESLSACLWMCVFLCAFRCV